MSTPKKAIALKKIKHKSDLLTDEVDSETIHVGIELEFHAPGGEREHDDSGCEESRIESQRDYLEGLSTADLLRDELGIGRDESRSVEPFINRDGLIEHLIEFYSNNVDSCDDDDCGYYSCDESGETLDTHADNLRELTGNNSFKVVTDSSIEHGNDRQDAEVCWNYFISRDTLADNAKIMAYLKENDFQFNKSCGLHINLNNYLNVPKNINVPTYKMEFLFYFVAASRRSSNYCNNYGMANTKYSMIYNQGDRLEFRFFSPTLEANKLNHYVVLAHTVYKRLAGLKAKLPKKSERYFLNKMVAVNGLNESMAQIAIDQLNNLSEASVLCKNNANEVEEMSA